jgi:hypothetical protein
MCSDERRDHHPDFAPAACRERRCRADLVVRTPDRASAKENQAMKYMLMMFGDATDMTEVRSPEWIDEMMQFMYTLNGELKASGELVEARGLAFPSTAKMVTRTDSGVTVTDGPFAEAKESLAGFWILDVKDEDRLVEIATRVVKYADKVEFREVPDAPPPQ